MNVVYWRVSRRFYCNVWRAWLNDALSRSLAHFMCSRISHLKYHNSPMAMITDWMASSNCRGVHKTLRSRCWNDSPRFTNSQLFFGRPSLINPIFELVFRQQIVMGCSFVFYVGLFWCLDDMLPVEHLTIDCRLTRLIDFENGEMLAANSNLPILLQLSARPKVGCHFHNSIAAIS